MKKLIGIFLCFVIIISFSACENNSKNTADNSNTSTESVSHKTDSDEIISKNDNSENNKKQNNSSKESSLKDNSSKKSTKNSSSKKSNSSVWTPDEYDFTPPMIDNSVEENIEAGLPIVSGDDTDESSDLVLGEDYGAYLYEGMFVNLVTDNNTVYSIFNSPNVIVAFDTEELEVVYSKSLGGRPAEVQVDGNNLLISFPDLRCIKVYNKKTFEHIKSISLDNVVSSFCIDGDIIYYSEDNQHCKVFCTNLVTNETKVIIGNNNAPKLFFYPKLLLNKEKGLLYVGESGSSGSDLYYYNTSDLSQHSIFSKDNYGLMNRKRTMFLVNGNVFWGGFRLDSENAKNIVGEYGGNNTYYADKNFVITGNGIYDTETYGYLGDTQSSEYMCVTSNKCLVAVFRHSPGNVVVAVPY